MKDLNREEIRENIVSNLSDIQTIKRYLHPQKYNIYQLLKEALKPFKNNTILKLQYFIYCILASLIHVIDLYIICFLIDIISKSDVSNQNIITIKFCDKILVLDKAKISGFASYKELMEKNKLYNKLYNAQKNHFKKLS